jgi:hypothetical protein
MNKTNKLKEQLEARLKEPLEKIRAIMQKKQSTVVVIILFICVAWWIDQKNNKPQSTDTIDHAESIESLDTFIPDGFALVPIEIENLASLEAMVGQYAVVDLYAKGTERPIVSSVKLVRSPKDPSQFAVLVGLKHSKSLVKKSAEPFIVTLQNPKHKKTEYSFESKKQIIWEAEK